MGQTPAKLLTFYKIFIIIYIENKDIEKGEQHGHNKDWEWRDDKEKDISY
jgi:hypothetical protein